jgi:hypothetical protein
LYTVEESPSLEGRKREQEERVEWRLSIAVSVDDRVSCSQLILDDMKMDVDERRDGMGVRRMLESSKWS